jgi:hypothetical protein
LNNPEATRRVSLWGIELSPLDITYEKRKAIKSKLLPDYTVEWLELQNTGPPDLSSVWTIYFDGSKRVQGVGAGVVLILLQGDKLKYVLRMSFSQASNNEAEYEALLHGMCNIPGFYQILDKKIVLFALIEFSQGFKTFEFI